jgi:hypothetical protein
MTEAEFLTGLKSHRRLSRPRARRPRAAKRSVIMGIKPQERSPEPRGHLSFRHSDLPRRSNQQAGDNNAGWSRGAVPRPSVNAVALSAGWRRHAETLRAFGAAGQAEAVDRCADELERALASNEGELLTLQQAARISGYSADHLGRLIRQGKLTNLGRPRAPRVRRGELPRKATALPGQTVDLHLPGADPRQVARAVVASRKGER